MLVREDADAGTQAEGAPFLRHGERRGEHPLVAEAGLDAAGHVGPGVDGTTSSAHAAESVCCSCSFRLAIRPWTSTRMGFVRIVSPHAGDGPWSDRRPHRRARKGPPKIFEGSCTWEISSQRRIVRIQTKVCRRLSIHAVRGRASRTLPTVPLNVEEQTTSGALYVSPAARCLPFHTCMHKASYWYTRTRRTA